MNKSPISTDTLLKISLKFLSYEDLPDGSYKELFTSARHKSTVALIKKEPDPYNESLLHVFCLDYLFKMISPRLHEEAANINIKV